MSEDKPTAFEENKWKPGQSGNLAGRPVGIKQRNTNFKKYAPLVPKIDDDIRKIVDKFNVLNPDEVTVDEIIDIRTMHEAMQGNQTAAENYRTAMYGRAPQIIEGNDEKPIPVKHEGKVEIELTGQALIDELVRRGLPTGILEE